MRSESQHIKYTAADIERYFNGNMSAKEMHELEKAALDDPFLAEALEGYESLPSEHWQNSLTELKQQFAAKNNQQTPVIPFWKKGMKLAAGIIIMGISIAVGYWVWNNNNQSANDLANNISATNEAASSVTDSISTNNMPLTDSSSISTQPSSPNSTNVNSTKPAISGDVATAPQAPPSYQQDTSMVYRPSADTRKYKDITASSQTVSADDVASEKEIAQPINEEKTTATSNTSAANVFNNSNNNQVSNNNNNFHKAEAIVSKKANAAVNNTEEVTISGYGLRRNKTVQIDEPSSNQPAPIGGWEAFKQYVAKNNQLPTETKEKHSGKTVTLHFQIKKNGKPNQIRVQQSVSAECDNEAIRLVENGPRWNYVKNGNNTATVDINF